MIILEDKDLKDHIATGVDAKIMQYEEHATDISVDKIDLIELLGGKQNCILINMEKDVQRYKNSLKEFEKVNIKEFVHLKGTDGRNKDKSLLEKDLTYILNFLSKFDSSITPKQIEINQFSEINDPNVQIQDGPLGCYCSHLRALIYGYLNFQDYTIICEDDISIVNTDKIKKYITQIPDDWDIICLNSRAKNISYDEPFYKFKSDFHSGHFYIVKNSSMPKMFENLYPMPDQIDVLISNMVPILNIYNIPETVYQKNIKTNTQNNLHIIFSSPNYIPVKDAIVDTERILNHFANEILPDNTINNSLIVKHLMYDVIYNLILTEGNNESGTHIEDYNFYNPYDQTEEYDLLQKSIGFILQCSKKGIDPKSAASAIANACLFTLSKFTLHSSEVKALGFGSTAHTYKCEDLVIKKYNNRLRWACKGHNDINEIINREVEILNIISEENISPKVYSHKGLKILMSYEGQSLYNDFNLPKDWKKQIEEIFSKLDSKGIYYPEFRLHNILVLDNKISIVDFGLAHYNENCDNTNNKDRAIKYLSLLEERFKSVDDLDERQRLISTLSINIE
jgi:predicted Ser/Thr protein kinase/GR25 family glycosyltransferase involved in LPS biosynthesis